jgi:hypothetical protein
MRTVQQRTPRWMRVILLIVLLLGNFAANYGAEAKTWASQVSGPSNQALAATAATGDWPMAGANPQRTSWNTEEVRGQLHIAWYRAFKPYIAQKIQIIAANGLLYIATANGLYAINAQTGADAWVYPTDLPLGQAPTIANGIAYVGGFDRKMHALNALTGQELWTFTASAGFETNPVVVEGKVFAGNHDGYFYALDAQTGQLAWRYKTNGPIRYSAAYQDGVLYFASDDSYAYALTAATGALVWKSARLPGAGFSSFWPVVYQGTVVFAGSANYRTMVRPGPIEYIAELDRNDVYPDRANQPDLSLVGARGADGLVDATRISEYFEAKPWRRTDFVLNQANGQEVTYDFDGDGRPSYLPILWTGSHSGNRYPPIVGSNGLLYQLGNYLSNLYIARGQIVGWQPGANRFSTPSGDINAVDEPMVYSGGGNLIYWKHVYQRAGAFDVSIAPTFDATGHTVLNGNREWRYYTNAEVYDWAPGISEAYAGDDFGFGGTNGVYGGGGQFSPPIPYQGKVYMIQNNSLLAWSPQASGTATHLPTVQPVAASASETPVSVATLQANLATEVQKILAAGHLRPGFGNTGIFDLPAHYDCGDNLVDYWHNPAETLTTLIRALPYLSPDLQQGTKTYLQNEFNAYPPSQVTHVGWKDGAPREAFDLPPEVESDRANYGATNANYEWHTYSYDPFSFYGLWKYAQLFGGAKAIFDRAKPNLNAPPPDSVLIQMPHVNNQFIAGYMGYLELEKLAGYAEEANVRATLNHLLAVRSTNFSKDSPYTDQGNYCRTLTVSRNFMYLVPELAQYLRDRNFDQVQTAVNEFNTLAPYWFVANAEEHLFEGVMTPLYDYFAMFQAKAQILRQPYADLEKYLDAPAVQVGDLFYIQNLVSAIEIGGGTTPTPTATVPTTPTIIPTSTNTPTRTPTPTATPSPGMVADWSMDSGSGTRVSDSSSMGNNGSFVGAPAWVVGHIGMALSFDGLDDAVRVPDTPSLSPHAAANGAMTVAAWVKAAQLPSASAQRTALLAKGSSGSWEYGLYLYATGQVGFSVWQPNGQSYGEATAGSLPLGEWHHVVGTVKKGQFVRVYLDGKLIRETTALQGDTTDGSGPLFLAKRADGQLSKISLDEVRIYNRVLTDEEIRTLAATPAITPTPPLQPTVYLPMLSH